jgi:hypothetical protein
MVKVEFCNKILYKNYLLTNVLQPINVFIHSIVKYKVFHNIIITI